MQQHSSTNCLYFTFGRFQPCTYAHSEMFKFIKDLAEKSQAEHSICISATTDSTRNILTWEERYNFFTTSMPSIHFNKNKEQRLDNIIKEFTNAGFKNLNMIVGNDRISDFQWIYKYKDILQFDTFNIIEYGNRSDIDVSATMARHAAQHESFAKFRKLIAIEFNEAQALNLFNTIKERLL